MAAVHRNAVILLTLEVNASDVCVATKCVAHVEVPFSYDVIQFTVRVMSLPPTGYALTHRFSGAASGIALRFACIIY